MLLFCMVSYLLCMLKWELMEELWPEKGLGIVDIFTPAGVFVKRFSGSLFLLPGYY